MLIEQLRVCALGQNVSPWLIEIVAGVKEREKKETNEEVIRREMLEEAGLKIKDLVPMYEYFTSPGYSTEKFQLYCARVDASQAPKFCGLKKENEDIKIHVTSIAKAFAAVRSGEINNAAAIIALQWLELNLKFVHQKWQK